MRTKAGQGDVSRLETTDAHWLVDLAAHYRLLSGLELFAELRNATAEVYVAARRPAGARPGLPRTAVFGVAVDF
jgi:Fe(3+) dicitrate transport protein